MVNKNYVDTGLFEVSKLHPVLIVCDDYKIYYATSQRDIDLALKNKNVKKLVGIFGGAKYETDIFPLSIDFYDKVAEKLIDSNDI